MPAVALRAPAVGAGVQLSRSTADRTLPEGSDSVYPRAVARIRLVPQSRAFYELFDRSAENLVETAKLLLELLEHHPARRGLVAAIRDREHTGDNVTHEIVQLLHKTFITPIDREDIYDL